MDQVKVRYLIDKYFSSRDAHSKAEDERLAACQARDAALEESQFLYTELVKELDGQSVIYGDKVVFASGYSNGVIITPVSTLNNL